jgi:hypothetical protein
LLLRLRGLGLLLRLGRSGLLLLLRGLGLLLRLRCPGLLLLLSRFGRLWLLRWPSCLLLRWPGLLLLLCRPRLLGRLRRLAPAAMFIRFVLARVGGKADSEKKEQSARTDQSN